MIREKSGKDKDTAKLPKGVIAVAPPSFRRERALIKRGVWPVAGCDEAGRGPLAGPVVAAAVVLREGVTGNEHAIRDFCGERLAPFKVPRTIVFLPEIPKGATGKLQRIGLAQKLGVSD